MRLHRGLPLYLGTGESEPRCYGLDHPRSRIGSVVGSGPTLRPLPALRRGFHARRRHANTRATGTPDSCHRASNVTPGPAELFSLCIGVVLLAAPVAGFVWVIVLLKRIEARLTAIEAGMKGRTE